MSPSEPEKADASPDWNNDTPSIEMARFKAGVVSAAGNALLRKLSTVDSQSLEVSAEAIAGIEANAAPTPHPTASNPSRVKARVLFIDLPFPPKRQLASLSPSAPNRAVSAQAYAQPLILFERSLIIFEKVLSSCLGQWRLSLVSPVTPVKSVLQALGSDQR